MKKENSADTAAKQWLSLQRRLSEKRKFSERLLLILLSSSILFCGTLIYVLPQKSFSEEENRVLEKFPSFSFSSLLKGEFTENIAEFYADQLPFRDTLVGFKAALELSMLKMENNSVIIGKDDYLIDRIEYTEKEYEQLKENLNSVDLFRKFCEKNGIKSSFAIMPRAIDILDSKLPIAFDKFRVNKPFEIVLNENQNIFICNDLLREKSETEYVWYKTDHHYTTLGAYYVYCALAKELGYESKSIDYFETEVASNDFLGTTYSKSGIKWAKPDEIQFFRYNLDKTATVTDANGETLCEGFYDRSYLEKKDKYSTFIGGNRGITKIHLNDGVKREKLVVIKDSFSHCLVPFLAIHYDIELIDLRYYKSSVVNYIIETNTNNVLIFYGIDTLVTSNEIMSLSASLDNYVSTYNN